MYIKQKSKGVGAAFECDVLADKYTFLGSRGILQKSDFLHEHYHTWEIFASLTQNTVCFATLRGGKPKIRYRLI